MNFHEFRLHGTESGLTLWVGDVGEYALPWCGGIHLRWEGVEIYGPETGVEPGSGIASRRPVNSQEQYDVVNVVRNVHLLHIFLKVCG